MAITAHRIISIDEDNISFRNKDYADGNKQKIMTLSHAEFLRRLEQHILPKGLVKIRHAGYIYSRDKMKRITSVCKQMELPVPMPRVSEPAALRLMLQTGKDVTVCLECGKGKLQLVRTMIFHNGGLIDANELRN
ncbi:MAG TPA: transposase [Niabella sp.]|nr:transposase [Niabella sp.]HQX21565.1 transposase [Niabella sp.]HRB37185.1 transposase [Niabella sp.]HRB41995.1 transposase [Niabella sp.]HRB47966.1 transposase [Niabella sp.]